MSSTRAIREARHGRERVRRPHKQPRCRPPKPRSSPSGSRSAWRRFPASSACARPRRGSPPIWSAAPCAISCLAATGRTSTSPSRASVAELARRLGGEVRTHERFDTAAVRVDGPRDRPGGDPQPRPTSPWRASRGAPRRAGRRPLAPRLHRQRDGGAAGRRSGADRSPRGPARTCSGASCGCCTRGSFVDDPTRALRAARYAARYGFALERDHRGADPARRPLHGLARPGGGRAAKARRGAGGAAGVRAARANGGCSSFGAEELWSWPPRSAS